MKRYGDLFNKIVSMENLILAHKNARKGKADYPWVKRVDRNLEKYTLLRNGTKKRLKRATRQLYNKLILGAELTYSNNCTLSSYEGILKWCDSYRLSKSTVQKVRKAV